MFVAGGWAGFQGPFAAHLLDDGRLIGRVRSHRLDSRSVLAAFSTAGRANAAELSVEVSDLGVPELLLEISQPVVIRFRQCIGYRTDGFRRIGIGLPVDRAQHPMFSDSLKGFQQAESFQDAATYGEVVKRDLAGG